MEPKLKALDSSFAYEGLERFRPPGEEWRVDVCAHIGTATDEGADLFYFEARSPNPDGPKGPGRFFKAQGYAEFPVYSYDLLVEAVEGVLAEIEGATWEEAALKIDRWMHWEFFSYDAGLAP